LSALYADMKTIIKSLPAPQCYMLFHASMKI